MNAGGGVAVTIAGALAAGVMAQMFARHMRLPGIIVLLPLGVALGPDGLGWIVPEVLGSLQHTLIGMALAVILFEGGLQLDIRHLHREAVVIRRLITIGALITGVLAAAAALYIMHWSWQTSMLFGTLVIVTGPTVVGPLPRRFSVNRNLHTILEAEGILIDPVGALIASLGMQLAVSFSASTLAVGLTGVALKLGVGLGIGLVGGYALGMLLRMERVVPEEYENILTLAMVLLLYELSNVVLPEAGITSVIIAGMVVGNMRLRSQRRLVEFKEQLTVMLIGMLFVLLTADVRIADVLALGRPGLLTVLVIMFVVRPVNVAVCAFGSGLNWRERAFMSWLAPRGIVAAAVASLFSADLERSGIAGGAALSALVFLVIAVTVVSQGLTAGILAWALGVKRRSNFGFLIVGANPIGRALALILNKVGEDVVFVDRNADHCRAAHALGFNARCGNALDENVLNLSGVDARRAVLAVTPNEGLNMLILGKVREISKNPELFVLQRRGGALTDESLKTVQIRSLFGGPIEADHWNHRLASGTAHVAGFSYQGNQPLALSAAQDGGKLSDGRGDSVLPLAIVHDRDVQPAQAGQTIRKGDVLVAIIFEPERSATIDLLGGLGFVPVTDAPAAKSTPAKHLRRAG